MPLARILCDYRKGIFSKRECLDCSLHGPPCPYTAALITSMLKDSREDESLDIIHVTDLIGCPRSSVLKKQIEYTERIDDLFWRVKGIAYHFMLETLQTPNIQAEVSVEMRVTLDDKQFTFIGRFDEYNVDSKTLIDYKAVKQVPRFNTPYTNHALQLNIYKYMIENVKKWPVECMYVVYMDLYGIKKVKVEPMSTNEVKDYIKNRLRIYIETLEDVNNNAEFGWSCRYCPREVRAHCWALELLAVKKRKSVSLEELKAELLQKSPIDFAFS